MKKNMIRRSYLLLLFSALLLAFPGTSFAEKVFGGLTFIGDRQGICIQISGECAAEDIDFELKTCDTTDTVKEKFKERMPFTLLVPQGTHRLVIKKDGKMLIEDEIVIVPEKVLEYKLP